MKIPYIAIVATLSVPFTANAKDAIVAEAAAEAKPVALFNGKNLNGWKAVGTRTIDDATKLYKVVDGCIVGSGKNVSGNAFLRTEKTYKNFEVTFDFKFIDRTGNSGFMFRANQKPSDNGNGRVFGYQCEGDNKDRSWTAGLYDEARRGWLFPTKAKAEEEEKRRKAFTDQGTKVFKWEDWNTIKIRCVDNHIQTWLNGELRVDFTDTDKKNDTREGFFGLQVHGGKSCNVSWKNINIVELPDTAK